MLASLRSAAVLGVEALAVIVEVDVSFGLPVFTMVVSDAGVAKAGARCAPPFAIRDWVPGHRITVNLAPADIRKAGASYDLPIALECRQRRHRATTRRRSRAARELSLTEQSSRFAESCRLPLRPGARASRHSLPAPTRRRLVVEGLKVLPVDSLVEAVEALNGGLKDGAFR